MQPFSISGKAISDGQRVLLSLEHSEAATGKYPRDDMTTRPDVRDLIQSIEAGNVPCHESRLPVSLQDVRVTMQNARMGVQLPKDTKWSREAVLRLLRTLLKAERQTTPNRAKAILDSDVVPRAICDEDDNNNDIAEPKDDATEKNDIAGSSNDNINENDLPEPAASKMDNEDVLEPMDDNSKTNDITEPNHIAQDTATNKSKY